jgi:HTH-type transcriptional regulator/antitoxin HigA
MEIKPIRNENDYETALKEIETLMDSLPGTPEGDRMDVLVTLVEAYEAINFPIPEPDESRGLSRKDLIIYLGSKERVSEIFNRKRGLSLEMIRRLHSGLGIPTDILVGKHTHTTPSSTKILGESWSRTENSSIV